ncbi:MAG: DNA double-strand break repair nuclease NurA, partial [candidate division WOR-3 bacterium]
MHERSIYGFLANIGKWGIYNLGGERDYEELPALDDEKWHPFPDDIPERPIIAVDGSYNYTIRNVDMIFAITGLAYVKIGDGFNDEGISFVGKMEKNILRNKNLAEFLSMWMRLAEIKNLLKILKDLDDKGEYMVLMDGSFISDVISPQPTYDWIKHLDVKYDDVKGLEGELKGLIEDIKGTFWDEDFAFVKFAEGFRNEGLPIYVYANALLLYYEYLSAIEFLVSLQNPIFFITKDSFLSDYVKKWNIKGFITDQVMFNICTLGKNGYAEPIEASLEEKKMELPVEFVKILDIYIYQTFVRLSPFSTSTYKVEILNVEPENIGKF